MGSELSARALREKQNFKANSFTREVCTQWSQYSCLLHVMWN